MALKHELSALFNLLNTRAQLLPPRVKLRALNDIQSIFKDYETIENPQELQLIKEKAENKMTIMDMSLPDQEAKPVEVPGVKKYTVKEGKLTEGAAPMKFMPDYVN